MSTVDARLVQYFQLDRLLAPREAVRPLVNYIDPKAVKITFGEDTTLLFSETKGVYQLRETVIGGRKSTRGHVTVL